VTEFFQENTIKNVGASLLAMGPAQTP
jgi:hypothetical protein